MRLVALIIFRLVAFKRCVSRKLGHLNILGGGRLSPQFDTKFVFSVFCRLSLPSLGRPNCLKPIVPRTPFNILCLKVAQNPVFRFVCRLSVPSLGRPFHHFERQSSQCVSKLRFLKLALMPQALFFFL